MNDEDDYTIEYDIVSLDRPRPAITAPVVPPRSVAQTQGVAKSKAATLNRRLRRPPEEPGAPLLRAPWPSH